MIKQPVAAKPVAEPVAAPKPVLTKSDVLTKDELNAALDALKKKMQAKIAAEKPAEQKPAPVVE